MSDQEQRQLESALAEPLTDFLLSCVQTFVDVHGGDNDELGRMARKAHECLQQVNGRTAPGR